MRISNPIILNLPILLKDELSNQLKVKPPLFAYKEEYFFYILYYISIQQTKQKENDYFYLDKKHLSNNTVSNHDRYIKYLVNKNIIESDNIYIVGRKPLYYKINTKLLVGNFAQIKIQSNTKLFEKIVKSIRRKKAHYSRLEPHLQVMQKQLSKLDYDYTNALKWINTNTKEEIKKTSYINSIEAIKDVRFRYFKRNKTNNRLDTNLTNLKSELKQFIKGDYTTIDVCNSQPFLLGVFLKSMFNNNRDSYCSYLVYDNMVKTFGIKRLNSILKFNQNQENSNMVNLSLFYNSVINGTLYEDFIKSYGNNITRKEVKIILFKVLFSSNKRQNLIPFKGEKKIFRSVYPFVYDCIYNIKQGDKENNLLPVYLQKFESYLFIDCIAKELVENNIIPLTVHDSVIIPTKDLNLSLEIIHKVMLKEIGVVPKFNIEELNPINKECKLYPINQLSLLEQLHPVKYG